VVAEIDDSALAAVFARNGSGLLAVPTVVEGDVCRSQGLARVGRVEGSREQVFAVSLQRRFTNPAVALLIERARHELYARGGVRRAG
jgi:LysR family transcriptional activator of nhaA